MNKSSLLSLLLLLGACDATRSETGRTEAARFQLTSDGFATVEEAPPSPRAESTGHSTLTAPVHQAAKPADWTPKSRQELTELHKHLTDELILAKIIFWAYTDESQNVVQLKFGMYMDDARQVDILTPLWTDPSVRMTFNSPLHVPEAISSEVTEVIQVFQRSRMRALTFTLMERRGKIVLQNGCFFMDDHLVIFPEEAGLALDDEGYIVVFNRAISFTMQARIGEVVSWAGSSVHNVDPSQLQALRAKCGDHSLKYVGNISPDRD